MNTSVRSARRAAAGVTVGIAFASSLALAPPALASGGGGDDVRAQGACSANSTWKLKGKHDDSRLELEFEVDSNRAGQSSTVRLRDNGTTVLRKVKTTQAPSGSFAVHARTANRAGTDRITATATNARTGETCTGHISL